ncbi:RNA polymerase sigma24 factor [Terrabacter tumescens]|uniref:RNA polymerase sigma24 factor n=1 Tax=Terrabacter tumescens TaxID=60443 RepID=A0ABQ2HZG7_9MICO|nr:RNA polymerase sigma factor [Terrabacter tumescens]GGM95311.1 RNA polymerase sigma24 factor [Terrabacter tumescens]
MLHDEASEADTLERLRLAALDGDPHAVDDLVRALEPLVMRRCAKFLPHRADAEEACQDALVAVATKLRSFSGAGSFVGWVTVIASNSARSTYRSLKRRGSEQAVAVLPEALDPRTTSVMAGSRVDLMEALEAMEAAKPHLVESFVLRDLGQLPYDEVAEITGVPLGTAKARIHDARAFMRGHLVERLA